jgi:hypothetical protein
MLWLDRIERTAHGLKPVYVDDHGNEALGELAKARAAMPPKGYRIAELEGCNLARLQPIDDRRYLETFGLGAIQHSKHQIFELTHGAIRVQIPSLVLLEAFLAQFQELGDTLLTMTGLDMAAFPLQSDAGSAIGLKRGMRFHINGVSLAQENRLLWLLCFPSGRQFSASIYLNATAGRFAVAAPNASVHAVLWGRRRADDAYFVSKLRIRALTPLEAALPFAANLTGTTLDFAPASAQERLRANEARQRWQGKRHPAVRRDTSVVLRNDGQLLTANEWHQCLSRMEAAGHSTCHASMETASLILKKFGEGLSWREVSPKWPTAMSMHMRWKRAGRWQLFLSALRELRADDCHAQSRPSSRVMAD